MRQIESFSVYKINQEVDFDFSPAEYSRFKYGSKNMARKFGYILADTFINKYSSILLQHEIIVIPSAFSHIQTASCLMESFFVDRLNLHLFNSGKTPLNQVKITRTTSYREDYGQMSAEDRFNLIKADKFHIDKSLLADKTLIFIDDIKITGTHERIIVKMLEDNNIKNNCYMLYLAELINHFLHPRIENYLNHYSVKNLFDLDKILINECFVFNTRVVKFILNRPQSEFKHFLNQKSIEFIRELFFLAIGNSYGQFEAYRTNLIFLQEIVKDHDLQMNNEPTLKTHEVAYTSSRQ